MPKAVKISHQSVAVITTTHEVAEETLKVDQYHDFDRYFVTSSFSSKHWSIMSSHAFKHLFKFLEEEKPDEFVEVGRSDH